MFFNIQKQLLHIFYPLFYFFIMVDESDPSYSSVGRREDLIPLDFKRTY